MTLPTTQGVGFVDETPAADLEAVIDATRRRLAGMPSVAVNVGPAVIDPEVVRLKVQPVEDLVPVRRALREAIVEARGPACLTEAEEWEPHISVAYSSEAGSMNPIAAALDPVPVRIGEVQLIVLNRDHKQYEWETRAALPLGG
ncbi:MAG TPA: 2'-5' RNA ligase family protein [Mycobacterium sp.]|uniref:2'-5' RNA ligase family protein n=1 Tax=Mycobacterium sp. TaxID=1785 RepID=UPI002F4195C5